MVTAAGSPTTTSWLLEMGLVIEVLPLIEVMPAGRGPLGRGRDKVPFSTDRVVVTVLLPVAPMPTPGMLGSVSVSTIGVIAMVGGGGGRIIGGGGL